MKKTNRTIRYAVSMSLLLALLLSLCACGGGQGSSSSPTEPPKQEDTAAQPATDTKVMKISHNQQATHPVHLALLSFKEEVETKTNGSVTVDIYPAAQLADDQTAQEQIIMGTLEAAVMMGAPSYLFQGTDNPLGEFEELPFLFSTVEEARAAYDGAIGDAYADAVLEKGIQVLCYWENGFRNLTNNVRPIVTPEDMAGIKFRIAPVTMREKTFSALGASAIPMAWGEVFIGLQQGTIEGQENPLATIQSSKLYEVQKYLSISHHLYNTATFMVNPDFFNSLSESEQQIIIDAAFSARDYMRQLNDELEQTAIADLEAAGMEVNEIDYDSFVEAVQPVWDEFTAQYGDEGRKLIEMAQNP